MFSVAILKGLIECEVIIAKFEANLQKIGWSKRNVVMYIIILLLHSFIVSIVREAI